MGFFKAVLEVLLPSILIMIVYLLPSVVARIIARRPLEMADARKKSRQFVLITYFPLTILIILAMSRYEELPLTTNMTYAGVIDAVFALAAYYLSIRILRFAKKNLVPDEEEHDR